MSKLRALLAANQKRGTFRAEGNTIYVYDMIVADDFEAEWWGGISPSAFINELRAIKGDVSIRINSPGGDVFGAVAICQAMREHEGAITVHVDGYAASAASVIAVAAPKVIMAPGSFMMIHNAWTVVVGNRGDLLSSAELLEKVDGTIADSYAAKSGKEVGVFRDYMSAETWFTAAEAVELGLANVVAEGQGKTSARWDMSAFAAAPKLPVTQTAEPPAPVPAVSAIAAEDEVSRRLRLHAVSLLEKAA